MYLYVRKVYVKKKKTIFCMKERRFLTIMTALLLIVLVSDHPIYKTFFSLYRIKITQKLFNSYDKERSCKFYIIHSNY